MTRFSDVVANVKRIADPQVGVIAVLALSLSLCNTGQQVWQSMQKAAPQLLAPEQILVVPEKYPSGHTFMRFAMRLAYVNLGPPQKASVVTRETLSFQTDDRTITQHWQSFENFTGRECELASAESMDVHPIVLPGEDAISHVTYFAPRSSLVGRERYVNFLSLAHFVQAISRQPRIVFHLNTELLGGDKISGKCSVQFAGEERDRIAQGCATTLSCED